MISRETYIAPPDHSSDIQVTIDPSSNRIQTISPFDRWNGKDFLDMPILVKVKGKCTTDHISPAGPWLKYKGTILLLLLTFMLYHVELF